MNKLAILEGLLFVVGDEGITLDNICEILEIDKKEAQELLKKLREDKINTKIIMLTAKSTLDDKNC